MHKICTHVYEKSVQLPCRFFDILALTTVICLEIAKWGRHMVLEQARITGEHSRVETELAMAEQIQRRVLPNVNSL